ncbi:MAG: bacteriohemerythrin [Paracoccaceae bacterium]
MKWNEEYSTGSDEIDKQHKTLFESSEDFRDLLENGCNRESYEGFLEFLGTYAASHFEFEEDCMSSHKCPAALQNKQEHSLFLNIISNETRDLEENGFSQERGLNLLDMIDNWMDSHICRVDVQLRDCISK